MKRQRISALLFFTIVPLVFFKAAEAHAAIAAVAGQNATKAVNWLDSTTLAFPGNVTSGNLLIVVGSVYNQTTATFTVSVSDSQGAYTVVQSTSSLSEGGGWARTFIAYRLATSTGANTVTVNPSSAGNDFSFSIHEFSGVHATPLDVDGGDSSANSTTPSDSITTVATGALIIGVMTQDTSTGVTFAPGASYTQFGENEDNNTSSAHNAEYRIVTTAQAYAVDWTISAGHLWIAQTMSFKPSVSAGPLPARRVILMK